MRIISGEFKGRRLNPPKNLPVRPTTDMAKEALFNILNNQFYFDEISVLDLFAGTGSISYEFASRGCGSIKAVDNNTNCIRYIEEVSESFSMDIRAVKSDVYKYLDSCTDRFDVIFADPPYAIEQGEFIQIIEQVFEHNLLEEDGLLIVEHSKVTDLSDHECYDQSKNYGGCVFSFFKPK